MKSHQYVALLYQGVQSLKIQDTLASYMHSNFGLKFQKL